MRTSSVDESFHRPYVTTLVGGRCQNRSMRIEVDLLKCESNGMCVSHAPEVFEVDDEDVLQILQPEPDEALRAKVEMAVKFCPKQALTIVD